MEKEFWDIYDNCFQKTGDIYERGNINTPNVHHLVVHIYPVNSKKQLLVQKRSNEVDWSPGYWAATGGSAIAGEDPWEACHRELFEELGIDALKEQSEMIAMFKRCDSFNAVFIIKTDVSEADLIIQQEEVAKAKWMSADEIRKMAADGIFHQYSYMEWLFDYVENMEK